MISFILVFWQKKNEDKKKKKKKIKPHFEYDGARKVEGMVQALQGFERFSVSATCHLNQPTKQLSIHL